MASYPGFVGPTYQSASYMADSERLINWYLEQNESPNAPTPWAMMPCPGFELVAEVSESPIRGLFYQNGRTFFVAGYAFYELNSDDTTTLRGTVASDQQPVTWCTNGDAGDQLGLTSGDVFYVMDLSTNVVTTELASGATMCGFIDGFGLILDAATSTLYITAFEDLTSIDLGNVLQRNTGSDPWKALYVVNRLVYLLGENTSDVGWNSGASPFPITLIQEAFMQQGIAATYSGAQLDNSLVWLSQNEQGRGQIVSASGYTPGKVSTVAIDTQIQRGSVISDALAFSYQENGHTFHVLTLPTSDQTWAFDQSSKMFHERLYWDVPSASWLGYRPMFFCSQSTRNLVGDRLTGSIYRMASDLYTDVDGAAIRRMRQPPRLAFGQKRFVTNSLQVVMDTGLGLQTGQGSDPQLMRRTSVNGGQTFGNEHWSGTGAIGQYGKRVRWTNCGQARNRVDQFIATDPVPYRLVDCEIDVTVGPS